MTQKLLNAKHWQLFIITVGIPFVIFFISMILIVSMAVRADQMQVEPDFASLIMVGIIAGIAGLVSTVTHLSWVWSVSTGLQRYMHPEMRLLKVKRFKLFFFIPLIYMVLAFALFVPVIVMNASPNGGAEPGVFIPFMLLFLFAHFFAIFCIVYTMYFTAKTFRSAEMQKEAHFSDYIGEFFLIYFFPVGIWFIQPRINSIVNEKTLIADDSTGTID